MASSENISSLISNVSLFVVIVFFFIWTFELNFFCYFYFLASIIFYFFNSGCFVTFGYYYFFISYFFWTEMLPRDGLFLLKAVEGGEIISGFYLTISVFLISIFYKKGGMPFWMDGILYTIGRGIWGFSIFSCFSSKDGLICIKSAKSAKSLQGN